MSDYVRLSVAILDSMTDEELAEVVRWINERFEGDLPW